MIYNFSKSLKRKNLQSWEWSFKYCKACIEFRYDMKRNKKSRFFLVLVTFSIVLLLIFIILTYFGNANIINEYN